MCTRCQFIFALWCVCGGLYNNNMCRLWLVNGVCILNCINGTSMCWTINYYSVAARGRVIYAWQASLFVCLFAWAQKY